MALNFFMVAFACGFFTGRDWSVVVVANAISAVFDFVSTIG